MTRTPDRQPLTQDPAAAGRRFADRTVIFDDRFAAILATLKRAAYKIDEFSQVTSIGRSTLYLDIKSGRLSVVKRGATTLVLATEGARYLASLPPADAA